MFSPRNEIDDALAAEQRLLAILLAESTAPEIVRSILERLKPYRFQNVEHQVLFECAARLRSRGHGDLLAILPAHLVRAGFPDVDLERFRMERAVGAEEAAALCRRLVNEQPQ